jgi:hypothetical protein
MGMPRRSEAVRNLLALVIASMLSIPPVLADPPPGKGGGQQHEDDRRDAKGKGKGKDRDDARRPGTPPGPVSRAPEAPHRAAAGKRHLEERPRVIIHDSYVSEYRSGRCPPGLAKKHNGCMPPGQAKKRKLGQPLPRDVIFHDLPPTLVVQIGVPPPGYRFVRVAADILLIAIGTGMVIDAIADLGNM